MAWPPAILLDSYEILAPLGAGGMGEVYLAKDLRLDREVALKVLPRRLTSMPEAIVRFRREALTVASLTHPNIATVYGLEEARDGSMVLVLEHVEGENLAERLRRGALRPDESLMICAQIAQALEAAHEHGVIHRDVKPGNVMIGPRGLVKVLDFGIALRLRDVRRPAVSDGVRSQNPGSVREAPGVSMAAGVPGGATSTENSAPEHAETLDLVPPDTSVSDTASRSGSGTIAGTPGYMSPEQALGSAVNERTDVFSFGCVLYECLAGRGAFSGRDAVESMAAVLDQVPDMSALPGSTPLRVRSLLERCLERDPSQRLASMRSARVELEESLGIRRASAMRDGESYSTPNNLPTQTTSFVGRAAILGESRRLIGSSRMLTLVGMGGTGKTRIAIVLAESLLGEYTDGVWFVNLAALEDSTRVADVAAQTLGVTDEPGRTPLELIARHVRDRRMLFVLDNCEEVLEGAAALASSLLRACPATRVLGTSRQALGLEGESVLAVPPLAIPATADPPGMEALRDCEAVQLFVSRAAAALPDFALTDANSPAVAEICRRVDGIPLALELAASRIRMLGVEQIRARLHDRFRLLTRAGSDSSRRQQTVKEVIQWSWDHLLPPEQDLMRRLAVFTGGWTLERATTVCSDSGDEFEVLDLLTRLAERSLVVVDRDASGQARYRFLESVWRFALEILEAHDEQPMLRERHLAVYLDLAERSEKVLAGPGAARQLAELASEEENLLAALAFSASAVDGAIRGLRLAASAQRFWSLGGRNKLGRRVLEDALGRPGAALPTPERAWALVRASGFALVMGEEDVARRYLEESLAYWRSRNEPGQTPPAVLGGLSVVAMYQSRFDDALSLGEECLALYRQAGNSRGEAMSLHNLGCIEWALSRGDHGRARLEEALVLFREVADSSTEALCLSSLAVSLVSQGEVAGARLRLQECFALLERLDTPRARVFALEALAELCVALGRHREAALFVGAAGAARDAHRMPPNPTEKIQIDRLIARAEADLGAVESDRARAVGWSLPLERVLVQARTLLMDVSTGKR